MSLGRSILLLTPSDNPLDTWKRGRDIYIQIFQLGLGNQNKSQHILHARNMVLGWEREKSNCYLLLLSPHLGFSYGLSIHKIKVLLAIRLYKVAHN